MDNRQSLEDRVESALSMAPELRGADIKADNDEGRITLKGIVDTPLQRERAPELARTLAGVSSVVNELRLRGEGSQSMGEYVDDAMITAGVKGKLLGEKGLSSLKIHVETKDGIVVLSGDVDTLDHAKTAERIALKADGVVEVRNQLVLKP